VKKDKDNQCLGDIIKVLQGNQGDSKFNLINTINIQAREQSARYFFLYPSPFFVVRKTSL